MFFDKTNRVGALFLPLVPSDVRVVPGKNDVAVAIAVADTTKVVLPDHAGPGYNAIGHGADEWNSARICGSRRKDIPVSSLVYAALVATPDGAGNVRLQTVLYADPPAHSMPDNILAVVYLGIMKLVLQKEDAHAELVAAPQLSFKRF